MLALTLTLLCWLCSVGCVQVAPQIVSSVFATVTRTNADGKMSVRDLRQWYITFGKKALREGLTSDDIVSVAFSRSAGASAVSARKENVHKKDTLELLSTSGIVSGPPGSASARKPLYAWEATGSGLESSGMGGGSGGMGGGEGPLSLPNGMLEFQVGALIGLLPALALQSCMRQRDQHCQWCSRMPAVVVWCSLFCNSSANFGLTA